ncbi:MAG: hypothetical protein U0326_14490 [Polyangiales bacterium]
MRPLRWTDEKATRAFLYALAAAAILGGEILLWHLLVSLGWTEWPVGLIGIPAMLITVGVALAAIVSLAVLSFVDALESLQKSREHVVVAYLSFALQLGVFATIAWILA